MAKKKTKHKIKYRRKQKIKTKSREKKKVVRKPKRKKEKPKKRLKKVAKKRIKKPAKRRPVFRSYKRKSLKRKKIKVKPKTKKRTKARKRVELPVSDPTVHKTRIRIIGIGGGGGSIVSEIISRIKKADFVAANTDARALKAVKKAKRFQFGKNLTQGLGTGMNVEIGEAAAQNEKEKIKKLFDGQDVCIIIACLGGGTGCGATPIFAKISKSLNCLTYGIFTFPFEFEGEKKMEIAKEALQEIKPYLNIYSVIPNERIFQIIDKNTPLKSALSAINGQLAKNLEGLIEMVYLPGLINIDFADLRTILSGRGKLAYLKTVEIEELEKEEAAKKLISSRLYPYTIKGARGIIYNIVGGKTLQLSEVSQISKIISSSLNKNAKIIFGISQSQKKKDKIDLTILATGCKVKSDILKPAHLLKKIRKKSKPRPVFPKHRRKNNIAGGKKSKIKRKVTTKSEKKKKIVKKPKRRKEKVKKRIKKPEPNSVKLKPKIKQKVKNKPSPKILPSRLKIQIPAKQTQKPVVPTKGKEEISKLPDRLSEQKLTVTKRPTAPSGLYNNTDNKVRRNALQVRKAAQQEEKELLEKEKLWETPAIFRRKNNKSH